MTFLEFLLELMMILIFLTGAGILDDIMEGLQRPCLKFGKNPMSLKASRTLSKIDDISRILPGVDDDFDVPDWGWCH